jgi:ribose transport system permease protein
MNIESRPKLAAAAGPAVGNGGKPTGGAAQLSPKWKSILLELLSNQGLLLFGILLIIIFSLILPRFLSGETINAVLSISSVTSLLALAEMIVIATNNYDLSIGYGIGLLHISAMGLLVQAGLPWPLVVVAVIVGGGAVGLINGLLVEYAKIDSFIATLGVGTMLYGIGAYYTNGAQVVGVVPDGFGAINYTNVLGVPLPAIFVAVLVVILWALFEYLPIGRQLYAIGNNRKAAELTGINARRLIIWAFVACGMIVGCAAVILAARLQVGQSTVGPEFLLPAFVGALLGQTTVKPGRVNPLGTIIAVLVLAIGIAGLQQLGLGFYVEPLFQGAALVLSVGLAGYAARRRAR